MKKLLFLFILVQSNVFAQYSENAGHVWAKYSYGKVDSANYNNFSVGGEWMVKKWLGLNYNFDLVFRNDNIFQAHSSAGLIVGPPLIGLGIISWLAAGDDNGDGNKDANLGGLGIIGGILLIVLPEGVSFHVPINYNLDFAPYVNIFGVDWMKNKNTDNNYFRYAATFGTKLTYWRPSNYTFSTFFETRKTAGMGWAFGGGLGLGYTIGGKRTE